MGSESRVSRYIRDQRCIVATQLNTCVLSQRDLGQLTALSTKRMIKGQSSTPPKLDHSRPSMQTRRHAGSSVDA